MRNGLDNFESNWSNNQAYSTSFTGDQLQSAGFEKLKFGSLNLLTNVYTPILDSGVPVHYTLPNTGKQLSVVVEAQTGAGVNPTAVAIRFLNQAGALHEVEAFITQGLPVGREFVLPLLNIDSNILQVATATIVLGPVRSGSISVKSPNILLEDFQGTWGAADEGL